MGRLKLGPSARRWAYHGKPLRAPRPTAHTTPRQASCLSNLNSSRFPHTFSKQAMMPAASWCLSYSLRICQPPFLCRRGQIVPGFGDEGVVYSLLAITGPREHLFAITVTNDGPACVAPSAVAKQTTLRYGGQVGARGRGGPGPRGSRPWLIVCSPFGAVRRMCGILATDSHRASEV